MLTKSVLWFAFVSVVLRGWAASSAQAPAPSAQGLVRVSVSDPSAARSLQQAGGRVIADYGSFSVLECDALVTVPLLALGGVEWLNDDDKILLNAGAIDTSIMARAAAAEEADTNAGTTLRLIQFVAPVLPAWYDALTATGVEVLTYLPHNAYLVYADAQARSNLRNLAGGAGFVRWEGPYLPDYKILTQRNGTQIRKQGETQSENLFTVQLVDDPVANPFTLALIDARRTGPFRLSYALPSYRNIVVALSEQDLAELAGRPDVVFIEPYEAPVRCDEAQDIIVAGLLSGHAPGEPSYLKWLAGFGFTQDQFDASGFVVDLADSGIDNGTQEPSHFGLYVHGVRPGTSRVMYNRIVGADQTGTLAGCDGHGTINAHIVAGYDDRDGYPHQDARGFRYGLGVAPFARLGSSVIFAPSYTFPVPADLVSRAYNDGARINSNSWGHPSNQPYDADAQTYDFLVRDSQPTGATIAQPGSQEMVIVFSVGNAGPIAGSILSPGAAKNVITVGASENVRPIGGTDRCGVDDTVANSCDDIAWFSSRGPTPDARQKPDLVAPGTHVTGGLIQAANAGPLGQSDGCFDATQVCGGAGGVGFVPPGQQLYTMSSGTSHSCPAVAAGAALIRQYFLNQGWSAPSPAMTKCILINSARYLTGVDANDTLPSPAQGMGEMDLQEAFARGTAVPSILRDQLIEDVFTATGQTRTMVGDVADSTQPVRVTLVWTDAPGSPLGAVQRNDLDLSVTVGGMTYKGNVFAGPTSIGGGKADRFNNTESVFLPPGTAGPLTVIVTAANINSDGVPGNASLLDQDFALVACNVVEQGTVAVTATGWSLVEESCRPTNGLADPGETVGLAVSLRDIGLADAQNVAVRLQATDGIEPLSDWVSYGALPAGGPPATQVLRFRVGGSCGQDQQLFVQMMDASRSLATLRLTLPTGEPATTFFEAFDSLTPPSLPPGWAVSTVPGSPDGWHATNSQSDSSPNCLVALIAAGTSTSVLSSPPVQINGASAKLSFRHQYNLAAGSGSQLMVSVGGGAPTDVLRLGGTFLAGAYTGLVSSAAAYDWGWTGDSGGWITTTVRLPAALAGEVAQFHWVASSAEVAGGAWYLDTVAIEDRGACCVGPAVAQLDGPSVDETSEGPVTYTVAFTEPVFGFGSVKAIDLHATGTADAKTIKISGSGAGPYTVTLAHLSGQGTLSISVKENVCTDSDGNGNAGSGPSAAVYVDSTRLACVVTRLDPDPCVGAEVRFQVSFSRPVIGFTLEDLTLSSSVLRAELQPLQGSDADYQVAIHNVVGNGTICLTVPARVCTDTQGNFNLGSAMVCYDVQQVQAHTRFNYQLAAALTPRQGSEGNLPPTIFEVNAGELFYVELWARQENRSDSGLTCVFADMAYPADALQTVAMAPAVQFSEPIFISAEEVLPGQIVDLGGCTLDRPATAGDALVSGWVRVAQVQMNARAATCTGRECPPLTTHLVLGPSAAESAAYGEGAVEPGAILYGSLELRVVPGLQADFDQDGDVDVDDQLLFTQAMSGPAVPYEADCGRFDLDGDGDVDQSDLGILQRCYSGAGVPADPACVQ